MPLDGADTQPLPALTYDVSWRNVSEPYSARAVYQQMREEVRLRFCFICLLVMNMLCSVYFCYLRVIIVCMRS